MKQRLAVVSAAVVALTGLGPPAAAARTDTRPLAVYLVRGEHVSPVRRLVPPTAAPARAAMTALLLGPSAAERRQGYTSAVPAATPVRGVSLARGVLTVDLGARFQSGGGSLSMLLRVAQVVYTATQFATVERVAFRLDGKPVDAIGGEGVVVAPPVGRAAFAAQAPRILVEQPLPGDRISIPLVVRGVANVFESQFLVDVQTAAGTVLVRRNVLAGADGRFELRIPLATAATSLVVVAYDRSPKDGARTDLVRVPVALDRPAPSLALTRASVDRTAHTVDVRLRICFAAGPRAMIVVNEQRTVQGRVVARRRWVPEALEPTGISPFECRADWQLNWLIDEKLRGAGTYTATIRVRDAYGRWTAPVWVSSPGHVSLSR